MQPVGMGALPRVKSPKDRHLGTVQAPVTIPVVYKPDYSSLPVKMQGNFGTCGGHAGSAMVSFLNMQDLSPKFLWKDIKLIDGIPLDGGTSMNYIASSLMNIGDCHEDLMPNTLPPTIEEYSDPSVITSTLRQDAYTYGTENWAYIDNPSWEQIKQAIYQNKVVIALVKCGDGWYTNSAGQDSWAATDVLPIRLGTAIDGHFILLWGYDENYIYFRNSWSNQWGDNGDGYFDQSYVQYVEEIGTAIPTESLIGKQIIQKYSQVVALLKQILTNILSKIK
jgi:hypothetical protein